MARHGKYRARLTPAPGPGSIADWRSGIAGGASHRPGIWIHAVSVGEVPAVSGLVTKLKRGFSATPCVLLSTTTTTGQELARRRFGPEDSVFYFPLDFAFAIKPYLRAVRPRTNRHCRDRILAEFSAISARCGLTKIAIVNARISDRSFPNYRRWRKILQPHPAAGEHIFLGSDGRGLGVSSLAIGAPRIGFRSAEI